MLGTCYSRLQEVDRPVQADFVSRPVEPWTAMTCRPFRANRFRIEFGVHKTANRSFAKIVVPVLPTLLRCTRNIDCIRLRRASPTKVLLQLVIE